jgi:hypothetical protein
MNRANVVLKNSNSALNKLITLISVNDVPRIHTFFKSCLSRGIGINAIVEKFQEAITKITKTKSYTQKELTNEFIGTCFNHKDKLLSYKFKSFLNLEAIKSALDNSEKHKCNECLVFSILRLDAEKPINKHISFEFILKIL